MPKHRPAPAIRTAVVAASSAAAALFALLPATTPAVAAAAPVVTTAPAAAAPVESTAPAPALVSGQVRTVALTIPAAAVGGAAPVAARASALQSALGKLGAPYRWGAAGPSAFDCSGLVNWSFKKAGVSLPRTSRAMSKVGTPVSKADLRPGDLVFFYKPVSHVAIYAGNGKVVHASTSSQPVKISDMSRMPFNSARRV
ncbi:C40 family peptidase [Pseudonocardia sp. H11422]|uniref:C40 family peptidase n=1 Tax=Pseudonocardia sp. H11422 TaxID=2835866 RepID=UPI001BDC853D|nr:C40 family peptidase [Pseudonocardia sp. H11422]